MTALPGLLLLSLFATGDGESLAIAPPDVLLRGDLARQQLVVSRAGGETLTDATRSVGWSSEPQGVVAIDESGVLRPLSDGTAVVRASFEGSTAAATVTVEGARKPLEVDFETDVQPILTRYGCNSGPCHGKQRGQNGFQLSLLGFDDDGDHRALVRDLAGRRVLPAAPSESLILLKSTAAVPHGGGRRIDEGGPAYETLRRWIASGTPRRAVDGPQVESVTVSPRERRLAPSAAQQLIVTAHLSDGTRRDVTSLAAFQSSEAPVAAVTDDGLVRAGNLPGEAAIMVRYQNRFDTFRVTIPLPDAVEAAVYEALPRRNFIDDIVWKKLERLRLTPSAPASDSTFLRRVHVDVIGRLPTPAEARSFLASDDPDKRVRLVENLLRRPEYADFWANKWADLLRPNPYRVGIKTVRSLHRWLRDTFRRDVPYDEFVRALLTARGSAWRNGAATIYRDRRSPEELVTMVSQLFLGIRLECARCHHHPFEVWGQEDFYSLSAYFARVGRKGTGLSPPISGGEEMIFADLKGEVRHPRTGEVLAPTPLFGEAPDAGVDPREALAEWIVRDNDFFARVQVNRIWADILGRGLVEPVDDLRATNPASNEALLDALAEDFRANGYDLKRLIARIMTSHVYGLSSVPNERNVADTRNYSRHYRKRLRAEVLLDAISDVTGTPERFEAMPPGSRAVELWTHRATSLFLDTFGRPDPNQDPPCERTGDTTVVQALHLLNSPELHRKVASKDGRAARLAASEQSPEEIVDELYLLMYSRFPREDERSTCLELFAREGVSRREATQDIVWALINTPEFVFID